MHAAKVNPSIIILLDTTTYIYWTVITKIPTRENYICMEKIREKFLFNYPLLATSARNYRVFAF